MEYWIGGLNAVTIVALYLYIQYREDKIMEHVCKVEVKVNEVETNYNAKFQRVYDNQHNSDMERAEQLKQTESKLYEKIQQTEENIRESHHKASDETHKALMKISISLENLRGRIARPRRRIV